MGYSLLKKNIGSLRYSAFFHHGFSLIEVIVVMVIFSTIVGLSVANYLSSLGKSRDNKRKQDASVLAKALEMYFNDNGSYPLALPKEGEPLLNPQVNTVTYLQKTPGDPKRNTYCYISDGTYYKLFINLENTKDPDSFPEDKYQTCDNAHYNYGLASSNVVLLADDTSGENKSQSDNDSGVSINWGGGNSNLDNIAPPDKILEVHILYVSANTPQLTIEKAYIKNGYVPVNPENQNNYTLNLLGESGNTISSNPITVPDIALGPPPLPDEMVVEAPVILSDVNFAVTVAWDSLVKEITLTDVNGQIVSSLSSDSFTTIENTPQFFSAPGNQATSDTSIMKNRLIRKVRAADSNNGYVDIAFLGDGYNGDFAKFHSDVNNSISNLLTYEPFKSRSAQLYFHYIDSSDNLGCTYYGRCVMCDNSKVISTANTYGVPYDNLYVLVNNSTYGGCAYKGLAAGYNGSPWSPQVFVHELGHSLAWLDDEYLANNPYMDQKNCSPVTPPDPDWTGIVNDKDYYLECNYSNWYRSSYASIMRYIDFYNFNPISQKYLNEAINYISGVSEQITPLPISTPTPFPTSSQDILPDLKITDITISDTFMLTIAGQNGSTRITTFPKVIAVADGTTLAIDSHESSLLPYRYFGFYFSNYLSRTPCSVTATLDPDNQLTESDETNNTITKTFECIKPHISPTITLTSAPSRPPVITSTPIPSPTPTSTTCTLVSYIGRIIQSSPEYPYGRVIYGSDDGQFYWPHYIAFDADNNLYVSDTENSRIQKFSSSGEFIRKWGTTGTGDGQFTHLHGIAVDKVRGYVYVNDDDSGNKHYSHVEKFDLEGNFIKRWGKYGTAQGQFIGATYITVDPDGYVYVSDVGNNRIQKFDSEGRFITKWGSYGTGDGQFEYLRGITVHDGKLYVSDTGKIYADKGNMRIQIFDTNGNFISKFGMYCRSYPYQGPQYRIQSCEGKFNDPRKVDFDSAGNMYVLDSANHKIQKFDQNFNFIYSFGEQSMASGILPGFDYPRDLVFDNAGYLYVADSNRNIIQKFSCP